MTQRKPQSERQWLIAYDVSVPRQRRHLASLLEGHAQRVQRSVFSTTCTQHECVSILRRAEKLIEPGDSLIAWPIVQRSSVPQPQQTKHRPPRLPDYWIV